MITIGLTGNVAAGKSSVARLFASWGATVVDADTIVRELQQPGQPVFRAIVDHFGPAVVAADGTLDRAALRHRIVADSKARLALNQIVHPAVLARRDELGAAARARGVRVLVHDIPLLFEVLDPATFDGIVLVDAPPGLRRDRMVAHRGLTPAEAEAFIATQMPAADKRARSTWVIDNDGDEAALQRAARGVWDEIEARGRLI